jgi:hypothetical protein
MYQQKILFGAPGTGKSYKVHHEIAGSLDVSEENKFQTIFHPETRYGDFVGKLLPYNENGNITYRYFKGPFLKALAKAYKNLLDEVEKPNVLLIIDEINRGNSAAIFGNIFQLLDRDANGWSSYTIEISELEWEEFIKEIGFKKVEIKEENNIKITWKYKKNNGEEINLDRFIQEIQEINDKIKSTNDNSQQSQDNNKNEESENDNQNNSNTTEEFKINSWKLPPNFSIVATMNTSDESIYYMDSAFKRRWDWEYVPVDGKVNIYQGSLSDKNEWNKLRKAINEFIRENAKYVRRIEDKLIGEYFIKEPYKCEKLKNKLLFYLWDSVFSRDKKPLEDLLNENKKEEDKIKLTTFGDFANHLCEFIENVTKQYGDGKNIISNCCNKNPSDNNQQN